MKYAPKKVYVKENNNFIEITNEEHEARKAKDEQYAKRWFIPLQGRRRSCLRPGGTDNQQAEPRKAYTVLPEHDRHPGA